MNKIFSVILILFIVLLAFSVVYAADEDSEYYVDYSYLDLDVEDSGIIHVCESYNYSFIGEYNGVYRDIPLDDNVSIKNIEVSVDGRITGWKM